MTRRAIFYDTETTGLKPEKDRIIEIAAYDPTRDQTFQSLINPECPIPPDTIRIHNITNEMVEKFPTFAVIAMDFIQFCGENAILIAHNNDAFDRPFVEEECLRHKISLPKWDYIDSLKFSRKYRPDLPQHSLQYLREYHGIPANNAHRALDDVKILQQVFFELIDDLPMEMVLELMNQKTLCTHMHFGKYRGKPLEEIPSNYVQWLHKSGALEKSSNAELKKSFQNLGLLPTQDPI